MAVLRPRESPNYGSNGLDGGRQQVMVLGLGQVVVHGMTYHGQHVVELCLVG